MKRIILILIFLLLLLSFIFLNLGKWIDITKKPIKSDLIVCLGGGTVERVKKSIGLFESGYSTKSVFILLGESWYNQPYIKKNHPELSLIIDESPKNTLEEVQFIKKYMNDNSYKSVLIVTDPPHSKRVSLLTSLVSVEGDENMTFHFVSSSVKWWDKECYYENKHARNSVWHESIRTLYHLLFDW